MGIRLLEWLGRWIGWLHRLHLFPKWVLPPRARSWLGFPGSDVQRALVAVALLSPLLRPLLRRQRGRRVLFAGQSYYHAWYLSRELRKLGWTADVLNWNDVPGDQLYFHGQDLAFTARDEDALRAQLAFYLRAIWRYDVFHFSNAHAMHFGPAIHQAVMQFGAEYDEVRLLKALGKPIFYSNNGCLDGVSQTAFAAWDSPPVCDICNWRDVPAVCSDAVNLKWGEIRNELADYQCTLGGNRADFNDDPRVHEQPGFYCLDPEVWKPDLAIPDAFRVKREPGELLLYHAVGNFEARTQGALQNIKSTHVYRPLVEELQRAGYPVRFLFFDRVPNLELRFYQAQADVFLDMLTFGWFGATGREALMLGKPLICYLRPSWIEQVRVQLPGYVEECPVISATPDTVREVLLGLIRDPERRREIGARGRAFALKWHSSANGARVFDRIYSAFIEGRGEA